uniref:cytochrome b n=1 Tax=Xylonora corona TaxID=2939326 RepID=UPI0020293EA3|nr:cytochrome b [Xylonora corona]UPX88870.1 cytochrome b [Xylonora corona]
MWSPNKNNVIMKLVAGAVYDLPVPKNISYLWNFGSLLGLCLFLQVATGIFLALHYTPDVDKAFYSVMMIMREVQGGWVMRSLHGNGASMFFFCIYIHIGRSMYYHSYGLKHTWYSGLNMLILLMVIAFTGYVLPWGQMSYWAATVITSLFSALPFVGGTIMEFIWGGSGVGDPTLKRFFAVHFICPFVLGALFLVHMGFLHVTGSSNPLGVSSGGDCVSFHSSFTSKDLFGALIFLSLFFMVVFFSPDFFSDPENFLPADSMKTPAHIQPEWYFLFAYSILRGVPSKLGGVFLLMMSVAVFYVLPLAPRHKVKGMQYSFWCQLTFYIFIFNFLLLSYLASCAVEYPYEDVTKVSTVIYFLYVLCLTGFSSR